MSKITDFLKNESGATAIEYGLNCGRYLVVNGLGTQLNATFTTVSTSLK